jgi:hypothetical protein
MKHCRVLTKRPAMAQSGYASKIEFKTSLSTLVTDGTILLTDGFLTVTTALFVNSLGLGTFIEIIFDEITDGIGGGDEGN